VVSGLRRCGSRAMRVVSVGHGCVRNRCAIGSG